MVRAHGRRIGDVLRNAGFEAGETIWTFSEQDGTNSTTSSSSFTGYGGGSTDANIQFDQVTPGATIRAAVYVRGDDGGDTLEFRWRNRTDSETVLSGSINTGNSLTLNAIGPVDYSPTTTGSPIALIPEFANSDNSTSVEIQQFTGLLGVQL